jgi:transposase
VVVVVRTVPLDVHRRFAEVAVHEDGGLRRLGRIETGQLRTFAESLGSQDHVVLESTAMTWAIAELLAEHAGRVTVSNPMRTRAIASAKVKTDKIDGARGSSGRRRRSSRGLLIASIDSQRVAGGCGA